MNGEATRETLERGYAAVLPPLDPERDEAVLAEQIRIAAFDTSESPWLLEIVAGTIEEDETVEDAVHRGAMEEAGLEARKMRPVLSYLAGPGSTSERLSIPVGEVDVTTTSGIRSLADENEDIRVHMASRERAYQRVEEGKTGNVAFVVAL